MSQYNGPIKYQNSTYDSIVIFLIILVNTKYKENFHIFFSLTQFLSF